MILLLISHCPGLRSNAPFLIISAIRGGASLAWLAFWLDDLGLGDLLRLNVEVRAVDHSLLDCRLRRVLHPVIRVADSSLGQTSVGRI